MQYIFMSHKIEGIIRLARAYQIPLWSFSPCQSYNPYVLASLGYRPIARRQMQCHMCLKQFTLTDQMQNNPQQITNLAKQHEQNCLYHNQQVHLITKEQLYLAMEDILNEMNIKDRKQNLPLLNSASMARYTQQDNFLLKKVLKLYDIDLKKFKITFMLQMFGWYFTKNDQNNQCLNCYFCGRSVPLEGYKMINEDVQSEELQSQSKQEQLFDPINQHRYFCLWTSKQNNWLVYLQHQQNKFSETGYFKYKTTRLQSQRMRLHIDKYLETARQKIETGLSKLKSATNLCNQFYEDLGEDKNLIANEQQEISSKKRLRQHEHDLDMLDQSLKKQLNHPLRKIRFF